MKYLIASLLFLASLSSYAVINQIEAEVGEEIISSRDILLNSAVEQIVFLKKSKINLPTIDSKHFKTEVSNFIVESMVFKEADLTIDQQIINGPKQAYKVLRALKKTNHWKNLRPSKVEIQKVIDIKYTSKEVLKKRIDLAKVPISDQQILVYFEQNKKEFGGLPLSQFKDNIRSLLSQKDIDKKLADWISFLRTKYSPENIASTR